MVIKGVYPITDENEDLFFDLWDEDHADPVKIGELMSGSHQEMRRVDDPKKPYCPDPLNHPNEELWMWEDNSKPRNPDNMVAVKVNVAQNSPEEFTEDPQKWIMGKSSFTIIVYKRSCCPEWSVMLCAEFEDGWEFVIKDSARGTHDSARQYYADKVDHDTTGHVLEHEYGHVLAGDSECRHTHKPRIG